jgi:hypothetical protein
MKKLHLDLDMLAVDTFAVQDAATRDEGSVQAHEATPYCAVTSGINSCWCSEYYTCDCA